MTVKKKLEDGRFTILPPLPPNNPDPESVNWRRIDDSTLEPFPSTLTEGSGVVLPQEKSVNGSDVAAPPTQTPIALYPQST
ncbi:MAG TPA: hypothetical protein VGJ05_21115 [Fimbriiglobus sp.]|jgi:hypothetical protein